MRLFVLALLATLSSARADTDRSDCDEHRAPLPAVTRIGAQITGTVHRPQGNVPTAILSGRGRATDLGEVRLSATLTFAPNGGISGTGTLDVAHASVHFAIPSIKPVDQQVPGLTGTVYVQGGTGAFAQARGGGSILIDLPPGKPVFHVSVDLTAILSDLVLVPQGPHYSILTVGTGRGRANAINFRHGVTGIAPFASGSHAFYWAPYAALSDLGSLDADSEGYAINGDTEVVGRTRIGATPHAFDLPSGGSMQDINPADTPDGSNAYGIDSAGRVVGDYTGSDGKVYAFEWTGSGIPFDLGGFASQRHARAISAGVPVGSVGGEAVRWLSGTVDTLFFHDPGLPGGVNNVNGIANAINDAGVIAGGGRLYYGTTSSHAFTWTPGADPAASGANGLIADLGTLGGTYSEAFGINWWGDVVGYSAVSGGGEHAFLFHDGKMQDLNALLPPGTDWQVLTSANGINDFGSIVGDGKLLSSDTSDSSPFLLVHTRLASIDVEPYPVTGGLALAATVTVTDMAPFDLAVTLSTDGPELSVPVTVQIDQGRKSVRFPLLTTGVLSPVKRTLNASFGGWTVSTPVSIVP
jgi:probable HAF family extracellular repeat protein